MKKVNLNQETFQLPLLALRGLLAFPNTIITIDVAREKSIGSLQQAIQKDNRLFVVAQRDSLVERPAIEDLYTMGTIVTIKQVLHMPDQTVRVLIEGNSRALLLNLYNTESHLIGELLEVLPGDETELTAEQKAMMQAIRSLAPQVTRAHNHPMPELLQAIEGERHPSALCDIVAANLLYRLEDKQAVLECADVDRRMKIVLEKLADEIKISELEERIQAKVREYMDKANHEYYLREQIRAIQDELGEDEDEDIADMRRRLSKTKMPPEAREKVEKELKRLARTSVHAPESSVSQNYIEYMLELPWGEYDKSEINIKKARKILEADHYGMEDVKSRLIEYLAVRSVADKLKSPIICLVGPPGVGKTSIAKSIAQALDRKFTRLSLGGIKDEAEIRGHRKTYVGAMPGRIISSINQVKTMNPVFLLDEIDKMAHDMRGDPASAMLEALDPEQNNSFRDHYLEAPFDLSDVLFITTANTTDTIDSALLDRMEIIEVPSYTVEEKIQIAKRHLLPKQREAHNLSKTQLKMSDKAIFSLIDGYTREAGVRTLERLIGKLCRKVTLALVEDTELSSVSIRPQDLKQYLGAPRYLRQPAAERAEVGVVNGLAWTSVGGEVMPVEALSFAGKGRVQLTGKLGEVMKESAEIAKSAVRARLSDYGMDEDYFEKHDVHIHVPEGAVPKDGPSAGVALACALMSAITGCKANGNFAMTGEITLHGRVLPIGGVKEKLLAAYRMGITHILLPRENEKDLEKIESDILEKFDIRLIDKVDEAMDIVLIKKTAKNMRVAI